MECAHVFGDFVRAGDFAMEAGHQEAFDVLLDAGEFASILPCLSVVVSRS